MTFSEHVLPALARSVAGRSPRLPVPASWQSQPELAGFRRVHQVLQAASSPTPAAERRPVVGALLVLAGTDPLATEVLLAALVPALRAVALELSHWGGPDPAEVDAAVALGACRAVHALGGARRLWPDRAVANRARDYARASLAAEARRRRREPVHAEVPEQLDRADTMNSVEARDLVRRAVASGRVPLRGAAIVWELRVAGRTVAELSAQTGRSAEAVSMERLRAERALRAEVA